ncbi:hypothetical protein [Clostridium perfringens]|uniref:hypothetical protein n=1 Tax=Clostridium perfringens TaxID=1502 RepID=UPI00096AA837|nr:hypothetical protein [Clostridium perfringens]
MENVDWSKYKGKNSERSKKGFLNLINRLDELNYTLMSDDYTNSQSKVSIMCNNNHIFSATANNFLNSNQTCKQCRCKAKPKKVATKNKVEKPKKEVVKSKEVSSIDKKLTPKQLEHFESVDKVSIDSKLTKAQLEHFENIDKEFEYKPRRKVADTDIKVESNKDFFEIDDSTRFPKNYNVTLGIPMKRVDLKNELRKSRLLGQISRVDDLLELSKIENN